MNRIKIGMPTLIEIPDLDKTIDFCKELNLNFIELNMNMPEFSPEKIDAEKVKIIAENDGIEFSVHMPEEIDLGNFHETIRNGHFERCEEIIKWSKKAGIKKLVMHIADGVYFTLPEKYVFVYENNLFEYLKNIDETYEKLNKILVGNDISIYMENADNFQFNFIEKALEIIMSKSNFFLTFDTGHNAKSDFKEEIVMKKYENKIRHMHLHDFKKGKDHQVLFEGDLDIKARMNFAIKHKIDIVIENKTVDSLLNSIKNLNEHYNFNF